MSHALVHDSNGRVSVAVGTREALETTLEGLKRAYARRLGEWWDFELDGTRVVRFKGLVLTLAPVSESENLLDNLER